MKKLLSLLLGVAILSAIGCNSDAEEHYFGEHDDIAPGITLYNAVSTQQLVSLDPTAVAIRFAMLLDEARLKGESLDEVSVRIGERDFLLKELLFGRAVTIEEQTDEAESSSLETGIYRIRYTGADPASLDNMRRKGTYRIDTRGLSLNETSVEAYWSITPEEEITLQAGKIDPLRLNEGSTALFATTAGSYTIRITGIESCFEASPQYTSDWSGEFTFSTSTVTGEMNYSNHDKDTFSLWGRADGATFYALNMATRTRMGYRITEENRLSWNPSETGSFSLAKGGIEVGELTHSEDYSTTQYPSSKVSVSHTYSEGELISTLTYNNQSTRF